ncbi:MULTISPECIES: hypothetical protein [Anaerococcus]|uniref:hypothetical protein n=1 Tax=Anaerococcus TaxID=165779 RepID=UPI001F3D23A8|nr:MULTISPECIES: hypothetical protein [Anaerococcus]MDY3005868.1 hypothetical protein [Anaerococcus porci]
MENLVKLSEIFNVDIEYFKNESEDKEEKPILASFFSYIFYNFNPIFWNFCICLLAGYKRLVRKAR